MRNSASHLRGFNETSANKDKTEEKQSRECNDEEAQTSKHDLLPAVTPSEEDLTKIQVAAQKAPAQEAAAQEAALQKASQRNEGPGKQVGDRTTIVGFLDGSSWAKLPRRPRL